MEHRKWLVVGDGNFSFSLALAKKNDSEFFHLVATSLESSDEAAANSLASENISELKKRRVTVLHSVDGTQLQTCEEIITIGLKYDVIVFNFPHTGGKGNIKENRALLQKFFISAVAFLEASGEIHVSLCRGQGGTGIDRTNRGYGNSWKIVEMAAEARLILTRVELFRPESFPGYSPTGYRGQNKGFLLEGALNHVFTLPHTLSDAWSTPENSGYKLCESCCKNVPVCVELTDLSEDCEFLQQQPVLSQPWHPVVCIREMLEEGLRQHPTCLWKTVEGSVCKEIILHHSPSDCVPTEHDTMVKIDTFRLDRSSSASNTPSKKSHHDTAFVCHPSSELHVPILAKTLSLQDPADVAVLKTICSPVLRNSPISLCPTEQPICHELVGVFSLNHSLQRGNLFDETCAKFETLLTKVIMNVLMKSKRPGIQTLKVTWHSSKDGLCIHQCKQLEATIYGKTVVVIAKYGFYDPNKLLSFMFFLETVAMLYYGIEDVRLFQSKDTRFAAQFQVENPGDITFKSFSLFPPSYIHDISFWYRIPASQEHYNTTDFDESRLRRIVRRIAKNSVASLLCVDVYHPPGQSAVSYCYRLVYSSVDQAVSKTMAGELQLQIRETLQREMGVELR